MRAIESQELKIESHDSTCVPPGEGYRLWAASYDDDYNPLLALEHRTLSPMLPDLRGKDALDVGCGTGRWLHTFVERYARSAVGVDTSLGMLLRAAAKPLLWSRVVLADALNLPLRANSADLIVCSFAIGHVSDVRTLACELARVARPPADVFVTDMHPEAQAKGWRCAFRGSHRTVEIKTFFHSSEDIRRSFEGEGFTLVKSADLRVGEPERRIFRAGRKDAMFESACLIPAVLLLHLRLSVG